MEDDDFVSERMYRAIQTFQVDGHDDVFTISGTGQMIGGSKSNVAASAIVGQQHTTQLHATGAATTDSFLFYLYLVVGAAIIIIAVGLLYYVGIIRLRTTTTSTPTQTNKTKSEPLDATKREGAITTATVKFAEKATTPKEDYSSPRAATKLGQKQRPLLLLPPSTVIDDSAAFSGEQDDDIPYLASEEDDNGYAYARHPTTTARNTITGPVAVVVVQEDNKSLPAAHNMLLQPGQKAETTMDDVIAAVTLATMVEQAWSEQGRSIDPIAAFTWATEHQKVDKLINARLQQEMRRYVYDSAQRNCDRSLQQQKHGETLAAEGQDKEWLTKLTAARTKSATALYRSVFHCFVMALLVNAVSFIVRALQIWHIISFTEMLCYGTGTPYDPLMLGPTQQQAAAISSSTAKSWYGRYASYYLTFADEKINNALTNFVVVGDAAATCATITLSRAANVLFFFALFVVGSWILRNVLAVSERLRQLCESAFLLFVMSNNGWVPDLHLSRLVFCLGAVASAVHFLLWYQYKTVRETFQTSPLPQVTAVNESLVWFDDVTSIIQLTPLLGGLLWMLSVQFAGGNS